MQPSSNIAFKEWAVVVDALGQGEQVLILRKGGIREERGEFHVDHREFISDRPATGWEALTSAEAAVAQLAAEGKTDREIAETLFISPHTVNTHLRHIFDKLGVNSRISLTKMAEALRTRHAD